MTIHSDGSARPVEVPAGSAVSQALALAGITIGSLDRVEPPLYAVLSDGDTITVTRVVETFTTEEVEIPFERQIVRSESVPEGETRLIQAGENGLQEITWRILAEDGVETSRSIVKTVILKEAKPEIVMVGAQSAFSPLPIPGKLVYLAGGNAWIMEGSTANRVPLVTSGDLDGRVFAVSPGGNYLLFTRKSKKPADEQINTLWVIRTNGKGQPIQVSGAANVVHYAGWAPNTTPTFGYSTVEPRATAPGWQANNDFWRVIMSSGVPGTPRKILEANSGGVYGWWGMSFAWGPDGRLAYARPDEIGLVDQDTGLLRPLLEITPLQTRSDWAWIPPLAWGPDARTLFTVTHAPAPAPVTIEESPNFDLSAYSFASERTMRLVPQTGMFAYPSASPMRPSGKEKSYQLAFLQAIFPAQSDTSRYRVIVMDRDGSNRRALFPPSDAVGLEPQTPVWAPQPVEGQVGDFIAVVYQGNLWLVDTGSGQAYQITGDGLVVRLDWK
ncbi:MAG: G5 domain-containing protein [Chloroflexota bacterium]